MRSIHPGWYLWKCCNLSIYNWNQFIFFHYFYCIVLIIIITHVLQILTKTYFYPPPTVSGGGVYWIYYVCLSVCPSVHPSVCRYSVFLCKFYTVNYHTKILCFCEIYSYTTYTVTATLYKTKHYYYIILYRSGHFKMLDGGRHVVFCPIYYTGHRILHMIQLCILLGHVYI